MLDFIRIACIVPEVQVGNPLKNTGDICAWLDRAEEAGSDLVLLPELAITGYTCGDLFLQETLLHSAEEGLKTVAGYTEKYPALTVVVGVPLRLGGLLYNCAAVISAGCIRGIVPKTYLAGEMGESRWFAPASKLLVTNIRCAGQEVPIGSDLLFSLADGTIFGVEICEDLWRPVSPSARLVAAGAEVILNLSASNELVGKRARRQELVCSQSAANCCTYVLVSAGYTESTQDTVFSGHSVVAEKGRILKENEHLLDAGYMMVCDSDLGKLRYLRQKNGYAGVAAQPCRVVECGDAPRSDGSLYELNKLPFVPKTWDVRQARCREVFEIQVRGLAQRLKTVGSNAVIGVSGGLDSTLALLVAVEAMAVLGRPASDVHGITMPCFGTTNRTYQNALTLMEKLGITVKEIPIRDAVKVHFADIGQDIEKFDATYENAQARERTQVLMDYAGIHKGIVVGTGDLSELALGWCTYNGDHMSMYGVNASVPKTLIRFVIETLAEDARFASAREVLLDILDTPISPELLPPDAQGKIAQQTEDLVGPYALHDFFIYCAVRYGFSPKKIYALACRAFADMFDSATVKKWLVVFYRRFFSQQFKRSCMPDGPKVGMVSFSPRTDWHMPSDGCGKLWIEEAESL
ncbi:MAG: NAD(+) synthase [Ruminococcaceae bacterium]|nr:NAD(+) synthase [Oscillospiraceae bacterium]